MRNSKIPTVPKRRDIKENYTDPLDQLLTSRNKSACIINKTVTRKVTRIIY